MAPLDESASAAKGIRRARDKIVLPPSVSRELLDQDAPKNGAMLFEVSTPWGTRTHAGEQRCGTHMHGHECLAILESPLALQARHHMRCWQRRRRDAATECAAIAARCAATIILPGCASNRPDMSHQGADTGALHGGLEDPPSAVPLCRVP